MNIKAMRNVHLYLGVFFAPLILFFILSGCWQTFNLNSPSQDGKYQPPEIIKSLSEVHLNQRWADARKTPQSSVPFQYFVLLMSMGLIVSTILGIMMAFKYTQVWIVWVCLVLGFAVPCLLLLIARLLK